jgi:hypothetical protein
VSPERDFWQWVFDVAGALTPVAALVVALVAYWLTFKRRPSVYLEEDKDRIQSWLEGWSSHLPHVRLLVGNERSRRVAHGTRVVVEGYRKTSETRKQMATLGSPLLGWPSIKESDDGGLSIPPGLKRPVDLGRLFAVRRDPYGKVPTSIYDDGSIRYDEGLLERGARWEFKLNLAFNLIIANQREFIQHDPNGWIITLTIAADDGEARSYDVTVNWTPDQPDPERALADLLDRLTVTEVSLGD